MNRFNYWIFCFNTEIKMYCKPPQGSINADIICFSSKTMYLYIQEQISGTISGSLARSSLLIIKFKLRTAIAGTHVPKSFVNLYLKQF